VFIRDEAKEHKEFITTFIDKLLSPELVNNIDVLMIIHKELTERIKNSFKDYMPYISILYN
jgi:hypothetical protein